MVEDLVSTGMSSLKVAAILKQEGLEVKGMASIFTYKISDSDNRFKEAGIPFYSLTNYHALIEVALEKGLIKQEHEEVLLKWREDPAAWNSVL